MSRVNRSSACGLWICMLAAAVPAYAHHAFAAEYDSDRPVDVRGVITAVRWSNPHCWLWLEAPARGGLTRGWQFELGAPNTLLDRGLHKEDLSFGSAVRIQGFRAKTGGTVGYSVTLILQDGRAFNTGSLDSPAACNDPSCAALARPSLGPGR